MKFDTNVHYKKDRHCENQLVGVTLTPFGAIFSIFMNKEW